MSLSAISTLNTSLRASFDKQAKAAEQIADPRKSGDIKSVVDLKLSESEIKTAIAAMRTINETQDRLLDIIA